MRHVISAAALLMTAAVSVPAAAQSNGFYLPTSVTAAGQDEFRAADGTSCRTTMDGSKRLEVGTYGSGGRTDGYDSNYGLPNYARSPTSGTAGVYGRFVMSLDARPARMDCNRLFELELERRQLEVEIMKRSLRAADQKLDDLRGGRSGAKANTAPTRMARNAPPL